MRFAAFTKSRRLTPGLTTSFVSDFLCPAYRSLRLQLRLRLVARLLRPLQYHGSNANSVVPFTPSIIRTIKAPGSLQVLATRLQRILQTCSRVSLPQRYCTKRESGLLFSSSTMMTDPAEYGGTVREAPETPFRSQLRNQKKTFIYSGTDYLARFSLPTLTSANNLRSNPEAGSACST